MSDNKLYELDTKCINVPSIILDEINELIEDYKIVAMKRHLDANNVKYKTFILYPCNDDYDKRVEMAIDYVHDMLLNKGYNTLKESYVFGYHLGAGKDCIEIIVVGEFDDVKGFIGTIGYDEYMSTREKPKMKRSFKEA